MTMESKKVCCIMIRKRNTTKGFLTKFEFPHLGEAADMDSVLFLFFYFIFFFFFLHVVLTPILFISFVLNLMKYTCKLFIE